MPCFAHLRLLLFVRRGPYRRARDRRSACGDRCIRRPVPRTRRGGFLAHASVCSHRERGLHVWFSYHALERPPVRSPPNLCRLQDRPSERRNGSAAGQITTKDVVLGKLNLSQSRVDIGKVASFPPAVPNREIRIGRSRPILAIERATQRSRKPSLK